MRGLDTNVLVRFITADDPNQSETARKLVDDLERDGERVHVTVVVLCELAWVLRGRLYGYDRPSIAAAINRLLETRVFAIQDRDVVRRAVADYEDGVADFADYVIGRQNQAAGAEDTVTFDRQLDGAPGFEVLA
jgi:predicted nucleic-acid-binding protein